MELLEQVVLFLLFILLFKGISKFFDNGEEVTGTKPSPNGGQDSKIRRFSWIVNDNIQSYSLQCEININRNNVFDAKAELLQDYPPSKVVFTSDEDYFNLANYEILHERFGIGCDEVAQITNYLKNYADEHYFSNYQFSNLILSFVHEQNIKYSSDEDSTGYLEYSRFPLETVYDQTGDCDCKTILAIALFKKLGFRVAFALMPGHAALAISTESIPFFSNFIMNGTGWFYCESTGDNWKPGQLPESFDKNLIKVKEI